MPNLDSPYKDVTGDYTQLDLEKRITYGDEEWFNRIWISETLGGDYKLFVKTSVKNKETGTENKKKSHSVLLKQLGWTARNILGMPEYKKRDVPNIQEIIERHVNKLSKVSKNMKTEEELLTEVKKEFKNQLQDVEFERAVEEAKQ